VNYIQSPHEDNNHYLFLAGGISNCHDWQSLVVESLQTYKNLTVINPRHPDFDINDPNLSKEQIEWEFKWLNRADTILFWFPGEAVCPITLFELGAALTNNNKNLIVGAAWDYVRRFDVIYQTKLRRPDLQVDGSLYNIINCVLPAYFSQRNIV
jgi:hypothetical protein